MKKSRDGVVLLVAGALLIAAALGLTAYNLWQQHTASNAAQAALTAFSQTVDERRAAQPSAPEETPLYERQPDMTMPVVTIDGYDYIGWLELPTLGLELPVMSEWSYARLKIAPCRYTGSVYSGGMVLAAHNYASHFGKLAQLSPGDAVVFTDADGHVFSYAVADVEILQPTAVEEMTAGEWPLTLFTCTYGGRTRLTIRCDVVEEP